MMNTENEIMQLLLEGYDLDFEEKTNILEMWMNKHELHGSFENVFGRPLSEYLDEYRHRENVHVQIYNDLKHNVL